MKQLEMIFASRRFWSARAIPVIVNEVSLSSPSPSSLIPRGGNTMHTQYSPLLCSAVVHITVNGFGGAVGGGGDGGGGDISPLQFPNSERPSALQ